MSNPITDLIAATGWCVADGATGSNFFDRGLDAGATNYRRLLQHHA